MLRRLLTIIAIMAILPSLGCAQLARSNSKVKNIFDEVPQKGPYTVFGRISNQNAANVVGCKVYLIKRKFQLFGCKGDDCQHPPVLGEYQAAVSSLTGDYHFVFDPGKANNLWVYFQAPGYATRMIEMDSMMHGKLFRDPGTMLLKYNIVLDPAPQPQKSAGTN
ncbi:MAG: hypothetical protein GXP59_03395 [Deltaproteobacteria bacterium]|nr:hypothetical protein [Deltaproteobacteria bacterium]